MKDDKNKNIDLALHDNSGALLMLNKDERKLMKELLNMALKSKNAREYITDRLGNRFIKVGQNLLETMGEK
jgi:hypothetical protein